MLAIHCLFKIADNRPSASHTRARRFIKKAIKSLCLVFFVKAAREIHHL